MKLYGFWRSLATYRVRVALALKGMEVEHVSINLLQGKQYTDAYKAVNPQSMVPALVSAQRTISTATPRAFRPSCAYTASA
jgi:glutathione S-transferase